MIRPEDGRTCPFCGQYFNPWFIRSRIARGDDKVFCEGCFSHHDIDDLGFASEARA